VIDYIALVERLNTLWIKSVTIDFDNPGVVAIELRKHMGEPESVILHVYHALRGNQISRNSVEYVSHEGLVYRIRIPMRKYPKPADPFPEIKKGIE
jgi:hypothetical protein